MIRSRAAFGSPQTGTLTLHLTVDFEGDLAVVSVTARTDTGLLMLRRTRLSAILIVLERKRFMQEEDVCGQLVGQDV